MLAKYSEHCMALLSTIIRRLILRQLPLKRSGSWNLNSPYTSLVVWTYIHWVIACLDH